MRTYLHRGCLALLAVSLAGPGCGDSKSGTSDAASASSSGSTDSQTTNAASMTDSTDSTGMTDTTTGMTSTATTLGTSSDTAFNTGECDQYTAQEMCPEPCVWRQFNAYTYDVNSGCTNLTPVGLCVYESADVAAGCGVPEGCSDAWGYIDAGDVLAFGAYCGGTPPEGWTACSDADVAGGLPECACACGLDPANPPDPWGP